jgi:hypothetical protein
MQITDILGRNSKVTLPTGKAGKPTEITMPELATYTGPNLYLNDTGDGVVFVAPTDGVTTPNSRNPRSEWREMADNGVSKAAWSSTVGAHSLEVDLVVDEFPSGKKPHVVVAQIHDGNDDVTVFRLEGNITDDRSVGKLWITDGNTTHGHFVADVRLGTRIRVGFHVQNGIIRFAFNGAPVDYEQKKAVTGCYFKAGCYNQSGGIVTRFPDGTADFAQVTIYKLLVTHSGAVKPVEPPTTGAVELAQLRADVVALKVAYTHLSADTERRFAALKAAL